ncbi:hypothetical protein GIB67_014127 [Kingdonia uniflora]|uniref:Uncharacterized protein n=1 Tax=Kingdonia uniflora TaxID=39325 RepID=A0A7J7N452_9MAGN|nr:hypothetical protein GIB67_014127 [Kingdonia uniflora]
MRFFYGCRCTFSPFSCMYFVSFLIVLIVYVALVLGKSIPPLEDRASYFIPSLEDCVSYLDD